MVKKKKRKETASVTTTAPPKPLWLEQRKHCLGVSRSGVMAQMASAAQAFPPNIAPPFRGSDSTVTLVQTSDVNPSHNPLSTTK